MDSSLESSPIMEMTESIARQTSFTLSLARRVGTAHARNSNLVFSPLSIHAVLGLLAAGSRGETEKQILSVLCSDSADELTFLSSQIVSPLLADGSAAGGPKLAFANGVWVDASLSLKPSFREVVTSAYKAEAKAVDFRSKANEAREDVNSWVHTLTGGLINELLPTGSVDNNTRLILGNALYFKGDWDKKFDSSQTIESDFYLLDGSTVQAPFMTTEDKQYLTSYDDFKVSGSLQARCEIKGGVLHV
ncbi:Serpin-ZX [Apostasia shenzhenica]|uniref:Serpin-ZX n=1 Tax=Apostasia shenzhenica TaxID=1088818 RepID=A0A2I0BDP7_9ASPA|nr:Serpin-ZX [Apostasia shenzhenica]